MTPHQMLQPQPTRQNKTVNNCDDATNKFTTNDPIRAKIESLMENLGFPTNKQNIPLDKVPGNFKNKNIRGLCKSTSIEEAKGQ